MKLASAILSASIALAAASAVGAQTAPAPKGGHEHGAPPPCCDAGASAFQAAGVVKKADAAKGAVTVAHGPIPALNWPAMTMAFKVKDKALLGKLPVDKQVAFDFVREGKDYVITAVR